jgi:peptide/nickel transport system substrate-binding protein
MPQSTVAPVVRRRPLRRSTMIRRLLPLALVASLIGAFASSSGSASAASSVPKSHTLQLSFLQDPGQPPDPDIYYAGEGLLLTRNLYEGLVKYKPGTASRVIQPSLATSWTISNGGLTYTFQLRQGVVLHGPRSTAARPTWWPASPPSRPRAPTPQSST